MPTIEYKTGRDYGTEQVLSITYQTTDDDIADVEAEFIDSARGISGRVSVMGFNAQSYLIGAAVLREYDAGRYTQI